MKIQMFTRSTEPTCPPTHQIQTHPMYLIETLAHAVLSNGSEQLVWIQAHYHSQGKYN